MPGVLSRLLTKTLLNNVRQAHGGYLDVFEVAYLASTLDLSCPECGDPVESIDGNWRHNGNGWEHRCADHHYTLGYTRAVNRTAGWLSYGTVQLQRDLSGGVLTAGPSQYEREYNDAAWIWGGDHNE